MEFENNAYCSVFALGLMPRFCNFPMTAQQTPDEDGMWITHIRIYLNGHGVFSCTGVAKSSEDSREHTAAEIRKAVQQEGKVYFAYDQNSRQWLAKVGQSPTFKTKSPPRLWPEDVMTRTHVASPQRRYRHQKCRLPQGHDGLCQDFYSGSPYNAAATFDEMSDTDSDEDDFDSEDLAEGVCTYFRAMGREKR